jgi:nucleotide-binding universal stress UspA family protein
MHSYAAFRIVAPVDLSASEEDLELPIRYALGLAEATGAELRLLYVSPKGRPRAAFPEAWRAAQECSAHVTCATVSGTPAATITGYADFVNASLLLLGKTAAPRWRPSWKRSVSAQVAAASSRPVCVAEPSALRRQPSFQGRPILCAATLDGGDYPVLEEAERLALRTGAELILMGVVPEISEALSIEAVLGPYRPLSATLAETRLERLAADLQVPCRTLIKTGSPYRCIAKVARDAGAGMVITARRSPQFRLGWCLDLPRLRSMLGCPVVSALPGKRREEPPIVRHSPEFPLANVSGL